jgi:hypothetical protein
MTGKSGKAEIRLSQKGTIEIYAQVSASESIIVRTLNSKLSGNKYIWYDTLSTPKELKGIWNLDFLLGGPEIPASKVITKLISWTETGGEAVKDFSGTAKYTFVFEKPSGKADAWLLNLGKVCESASIILNDNELTTLIGPDYQVVIDKILLKTQNKLEIKVSNLAANHIAYLDRNNILWKKFYNSNYPSRLRQNSKNGLFDASAWKPRESGLIGPVTLTPLKRH